MRFFFLGVNESRRAAKRVAAPAVWTGRWVIEPEPAEKSPLPSAETVDFMVLNMELASGIRVLST